ncbi:hypothetical protein B0J17DRAFT_660556 [Rhizoctonia solani]|nr:hypothetical protein B0J17DRAFT_660556 [Rhizoctonia solani]
MFDELHPCTRIHSHTPCPARHAHTIPASLVLCLWHSLPRVCPVNTRPRLRNEIHRICISLQGGAFTCLALVESRYECSSRVAKSAFACRPILPQSHRSSSRIQPAQSI